MRNPNQASYGTGNKSLGLDCVAVTGWEDTAAFLEALIPEFGDIGPALKD